MNIHCFRFKITSHGGCIHYELKLEYEQNVHGVVCIHAAAAADDDDICTIYAVWTALYFVINKQNKMYAVVVV